MEKEYTLKNGRKVTVKELSALDDVLSYRLVGGGFDEKNAMSAAVTQRAVLTVLSLTSVDGARMSPPVALEAVFQTLAKFTKKEWSEVTNAYTEMNEDDGEDTDLKSVQPSGQSDVPTVDSTT